MAKEDQFLRDSLTEIRDTLKDMDDQINEVDKTLAEYKVSFDHHIKQDEAMYEEFKRMNDILAENTESLKHHIKRTALLEEAVMKMDMRLNPIELERLRKQAVNAWLKEKSILVAKIAGAIGAAVGAIVAAEPLWRSWLN